MRGQTGVYPYLSLLDDCVVFFCFFFRLSHTSSLCPRCFLCRLSPFASFGGGSDDTFLMSLRSDEGLTDLFGDDDWVDGSGPL